MSIKTCTKDTHKNTFQKIQNKLTAVPSEAHAERSGRPQEDPGKWDFTTFSVFNVVFYHEYLWSTFKRKSSVMQAAVFPQNPAYALSSRSARCAAKRKPHWILSFLKCLSHLSPAPTPCSRLKSPRSSRQLGSCKADKPEIEKAQDPTLRSPTFHGFFSTHLINGDTQLPQRESVRTCPNDEIQNQTANYRNFWQTATFAV